jgi:hypothetical protein
MDKLTNNLKKKYSKCLELHHRHSEAAEHYRNLYYYTNIPIIISSSVTTVVASFNGNFMNSELAIGVALLSGLTTIGHALTSFFEFGSKTDQHRNVANRYLIAAQTIDANICLNIDQPAMTELMLKMHKLIISIEETEPILPYHIKIKQLEPMDALEVEP